MLINIIDCNVIMSVTVVSVFVINYKSMHWKDPSLKEGTGCAVAIVKILPQNGFYEEDVFFERLL